MLVVETIDQQSFDCYDILTVIDTEFHAGCLKKNAPTLQCHIFKNFEFDVLKFSTVI